MNNNVLCQTTWVDDNQDKKRWYRLGDRCEIIRGVHFRICTYYREYKTYITEHTANAETLIPETQDIMRELISQAENMIIYFREYLNKTMNESDLKVLLMEIAPVVTRLYLKLGNLDLPPVALKKWNQCCENLASTIHNMTLYYGDNSFAKRTPENRMQCMKLEIEKYYQDLEKLRVAETELQELL